MLPPERPGARATSYYFLAVLLFLYLKTFILPSTPIYQGDNAPVFLLEARRMLEGEVIYRDFFQFTFPGTQFLYLFLFKLFGVRAWIPEVLLVLVGLGMSWLALVISRRLVSGKAALLPGLLFVSLAYGNALDATHHWLSTLAVTGALALVIDERTFGRLAGAGALCGLATCFTQSRGLTAIVALAFFSLWESHTQRRGARWLVKAQASLFATFFVPVIPILIYVSSKAGVDRLVYCLFTFVFRYYSKFNRNNLDVYFVDVPTYSSWLELPALGVWLFIHGLVPLVFLSFFARYWLARKTQPEEPRDQLMLVNLMGLASFLAVANAPNWLKVSTVSLPALILFVWFLGPPRQHHQVTRGFLWFVALLAALLQPLMVQTGWHRELETPAGRVAVLDPDRYQKYRWLLRRAHSSDGFFEAGDTDVYFLLGLKDPVEEPFLTTTDYTRPEQVQGVLEALEMQRVRWVLWLVELDLPDPGRRSEDHLGPLRVYLRRRYRVVETFYDGAQIWERAGGAQGQGPPAITPASGARLALCKNAHLGPA